MMVVGWSRDMSGGGVIDMGESGGMEHGHK